MVKRASRLALGVTLVAGVLAFSSAPTEAKALRCQGKIVTIRGNGKANKIQGTNGPDVIHALGGNDIVYGNGGNDTICLGKGNDKGFGGNGRDRVSGGDGNDLVNGGRHFDRLRGEAGHDLIDGGGDGAYAWGGPGWDACYGVGGPGIGDDPPPGCNKDQLWWGPSVEFSDKQPLALNSKGGLDNDARTGLNMSPHQFRRGIGCEPGNGFGGARRGDFCSFTFATNANYKRFASYVGEEDLTMGSWKVRFVVIGDGKWIESRVVTANQTKKLVADISGVKRLKLKIVNLNRRPKFQVPYHYFTDPRISRHPGLYPVAPIG